MTSIALVRSIREQVVDRLRDEILSGRLAEDEPLREVEIAKRFGTSRGPIREALLQLAHEGFVAAKPNCGMRVAACSTGLIHDLVVPLRQMVETFALKQFFDEIGDEDYRVWERILGDMREACLKADYVTIAEQDIMFHRSIIERANLPDVTAIWSTLVSRLRHHFQETQTRYSNPMTIFEEHTEIVEVFRTGDLEASIKALERNIA